MSEALKDTNVYKNCLGPKGLNCWLWGRLNLELLEELIRGGRHSSTEAWRSGAQTQQQEIDGAAFAYRRSDGMSVPAGRSFSSPSSRKGEHVLLVAEGQSLAHLYPLPTKATNFSPGHCTSMSTRRMKEVMKTDKECSKKVHCLTSKFFLM